MKETKHMPQQWTDTNDRIRKQVNLEDPSRHGRIYTVQVISRSEYIQYKALQNIASITGFS